MPSPVNLGIQTQSPYGVPVDAMGNPVQAAAKMVLTDGTTASPQTVSSTEIDLTVPAGAVAFVVESSGAACRVAIANGATATSYFVVRDGKTERFPCMDIATFHLMRNAAVDASVTFYFELLGT